MPNTLYVLTYQPDPAAGPLAGQLFPAHAAHYTAAAERGDLLLFGPFADLFKDGSMGIFASRAAAEAFVAADPFVQQGVVARHEIREWSNSIASIS